MRASTSRGLVAAAFGAALLFGLWGFRSRSLTHDEAVTWLLSQHPITWAFRADVHPPLFYVWFWPLRAVCGRPEWMRPLSALVAALALLPMAPLLKRSLPHPFPLLALGLLAILPLRVQAAHLARPYSFLLLFETLSLLLASESYEREGRGWWRYSLISAVALLTHALFLLTFLGRALLFLLDAVRRGEGGGRARAARLLLLASCLSLLPFLGWLCAHGPPPGTSAPAGARAGLAGLILALEEPAVSFVTSFWRLPEGWGRLLFLLWPVLWGTALLGGLRRGRPLALCLSSWLAGGAVLAVLCGSGRAVPLAIYALPLAPGFLACLAAGAAELEALLPRAGASLALLAASINLAGSALYLGRGGDNLDWREVARRAERLAGPSGAIVCRPPAAASVLRFYVRKAPVLPREPVIMVVAGVGRQVLPWGEPYRGEGREAREGLKFRRVVLVNWLWKAPPRPEVPRWLLAGGYERKGREEVAGYTQRAILDVYERGEFSPGGSSVKMAPVSRR